MLSWKIYLTVAPPIIRATLSPRGLARRARYALMSKARAAAPAPPISLGAVLRADEAPGGLDLHCAGGLVRAEMIAPGVARVQVSRQGARIDENSIALVDLPGAPKTTVSRDEEISVVSAGLRIAVSPAPCRLTFTGDTGEVLWAEACDVRWEGSSVTCAFHLAADTALYGLGEKAFGLNRRGRRMVMWNTDPGGRYVQGSDPLYVSIPVVLSQRDGFACGLFFDSARRAEFDLGDADPAMLRYCVTGDQLSYTVLAGPSLADVLRRYADLTGHMSLPPRWALGYHQSRWGYRDAEMVRRVADELRSHRIPCDALHLDLDYMDGCRVFTWSRERFPDPVAFTDELRDQGFRTVAIVDPGVKTDPAYDVCAEGLKQDAFCTLPDGSHFVGPVWPGDCYFPDFADTAVRAWWGELYGRLLDAGIAGFWNDMNEPAIFPSGTLPLAVLHRTPAGLVDHAMLHNAYGFLMARACFEGVTRLRPDERPFIISRSGYAGIQRYALNWTGDNSSSWEHLRLTIPMVLSLGLSGQPFSGTDVGGFAGNCTGELLVRWIQLGACLPFFRNHNALGYAAQEPWAFGEPYESICRRYIELRYQLLPYLYTAFWQAAERGLPVVRPLTLAFPGDRRLASLDDQFMLGDALLVAPVLEQGASGRGVYLPAGSSAISWYDFWTGRQMPGAQDVPAAGPLHVLPLYARRGSVVPLGPVMQHTDELEPEVLALHVFPGDGESWLYEDDGHSNAHRNGARRVTRFAMTAEPGRLVLVREPDGAYEAGSRRYDLFLRGLPADTPAEVIVDDQPVEALTFDPEWHAWHAQVGSFHRIVVRHR